MGSIGILSATCQQLTPCPYQSSHSTCDPTLIRTLPKCLNIRLCSSFLPYPFGLSSSPSILPTDKLQSAMYTTKRALALPSCSQMLRRQNGCRTTLKSQTLSRTELHRAPPPPLRTELLIQASVLGLPPAAISSSRRPQGLFAVPTRANDFQLRKPVNSD